MQANLARRIHELICETLELEPQDRRRTIDLACANDPELALRKSQLLDAIDESRNSEFLEQPALAGIAESGRQKSWEVPERIGNYRIVGAIGSGGMATVYEAIQDHPTRRVAIKIPHQDRRGSALNPDLNLESEVLARLRHPAIAQIYEAGTHSLRDGTKLHYFAMEFVSDASRLTNYTNQRKLSLDEKLNLFATICSAVHHGHRNGIIHRDLKPGNILVDGDGNPKVIDFGLARTGNPDDVIQSGADTNGRVVGTLNYLSPELCTPGTLWDARSDVYSLGVVLYELLCNELPHSLSDVPIPEAFRRLREDPPLRPTLVNSAIPADLEAIILKAIHPDPEKRYSGADALASDLQRFRSHLPVEARPLTLRYQLRKFARRNRALTVSLLALLLLMIAGVIIASRLAWLANQSRKEADQRSEELEVVVQFQESLLRDLNIAAMGDQLEASFRDALNKSLSENDDAAREELAQLTAGVNFSTLAIQFLRENILQRYSDSIQAEFADQPILKARMLQRLAGTFHALGLYAEAESPLREALRLRKEHLGDRHADTLSSLHALGSLLNTLGQHAVACELLEEAYSRRTQELGAEHRETLRSGVSLGGVYRHLDRLKEAEEIWSQTLATQRRVLGDDDPETFRTLNNMGVVCAYQGRMKEAETYWRELVERRRRVQGTDHPDYRGSLGNLGSLLLDQGKIDEARPLIEEALASDRRHFGDLNSNTLVTMTQLGDLLHRVGELEEAERLMRECVEGRRETFGSENAATLRVEAALAMILLDRGDSSEAELLLQKTLSQQRKLHGGPHYDTIQSIFSLSLLKQKAGELDEAISLSSEAVQLAREIELQGDLSLGEVISRHGELLLEKLTQEIRSEGVTGFEKADQRAGQRVVATNLQDESGTLLLEGYELLSNSIGSDHSKTKQAALRLARFFELAHTYEPTSGHNETAEIWRKKANSD